MKTNLIKLGRTFITLATLLAASLHLSALAQNIVVTYHGRVTSNGTNFTGAGQFKAVVATSTNTSAPATATAARTGQFVTSVAVTAGGNGYVTPPAVSFAGGGGSGAAATATISGGAVTAITVNNAGSGYTSAPVVTLAAPPENIVFTTYWSNDGTSSAGSEPAAAVGVTVPRKCVPAAVPALPVVRQKLELLNPPRVMAFKSVKPAPLPVKLLPALLNATALE